MDLKHKVYTGFKILDISSVKYYRKEIILSIFALFIAYFIFLSGRNYVITHDPLHVLQENWKINSPANTQIIEIYDNTDWLGEGTKLSVLKIDKEDTLNTFFDLKYFHTGLSVDEHETMLDLLKNLSKTDLKKNILNDSVKFRETAIKSKAWDGALEDRCNLYVCYDEKTANYYLFEVLR